MPKKYFILLIAAVFSFFMTPQALAQETTDGTPTTTTTVPNRGIGKQVKQAAKEQRMMTKEQKQEMRAAFKTTLSQFKDTRKQAVIQNIDQKLGAVNTNRTAQMNTIVTKLETILTRIKTKAAELKTQGVTTTTLETAIAQAETAVATAKTNIANQAAKEYTISLTTETQAKNAVGQTVSGLQADLRTVKQSLIATKQAVMKAATELAKAKGEATGTITPTTPAQ